ncbi:MAG: hypothetical protein SWX82_22850 [Cyanobacteriota bacterium]|nr:hypothetical protein [Cyanobacteriota bacterium]
MLSQTQFIAPVDKAEEKLPVTNYQITNVNIPEYFGKDFIKTSINWDKHSITNYTSLV